MHYHDNAFMHCPAKAASLPQASSLHKLTFNITNSLMSKLNIVI